MRFVHYIDAPATPEQKIMVTLKSYAAEVERQKASQRSRDALERKVQKGYNPGGIAYGYDNERPWGQVPICSKVESGLGSRFVVRCAASGRELGVSRVLPPSWEKLEASLREVPV